MWRPATREVTGTNEGRSSFCDKTLNSLTNIRLVPLGTRRRFGPAPAEETARPQLAQPSPSAYPKQSNQDQDSRRGREETPTNSQGKPIILEHRLPKSCFLAKHFSIAGPVRFAGDPSSSSVVIAVTTLLITN
jgi:hypothetical protein